MVQSTLASICSVGLFKRSYESEKLLTSVVMFWLEYDCGKTLHSSAWLAYDKLKISSIFSQGSMKIDFLLYSATGRLPRVPLDALVIRDLDLEETLLYHL